MSIFLRKKLSSNFTTLPNSLIRDPNLSWKATGFLTYLLSCADGWELNFVDLSKRKKDGEAATRAAAKELKKTGYLEINKVRDDKGRIISHEWVVSNQPELKTPDVDNPDVDFPHLDNQGQRNNNSKRNSSNNKQPQQQGSGGGLIFEKEISLEDHAALAKILDGVEPLLAQNMLDVVAAMGDKVKTPTLLVKSFLAKVEDFDPAPGRRIARRRQNEKQAAEKLKAMRTSSSNPKNFDLYREHKTKWQLGGKSRI